MPFCRHHYRYTQGYFFCTKCGHKQYSGSYRRRRRGKRIGIGLGIFVAIIVFGYVIVNNVDIFKIPSSIAPEQVPSITKELQKQGSEISKSLQKGSDILTESLKPEPPPPLDELKQIALDDINKYRAENNARALVLGTAISPQLYAEELLEERCIHHVSNNGEGPMLRYKINNDKMYLVAENIAGGGIEGSVSGQITAHNWGMMYDDAESNWGHRDNMINPEHTSVSIGIAFDNNNLVMVQDFEHSLRQGYMYDPSSFQYESVDKKFCW